jgi:peptidoglycan/xylan/chitin deacetylase (PgdA/CDA1 family)
VDAQGTPGHRGRPAPRAVAVLLVIAGLAAGAPAARAASEAPEVGGEAAVAAARGPLVNTCPTPVAGLRAEHSGSRRTVALTFDDGPHPEYTPAVLDELDRLGIRATFVVVGQRVERHPQLARSIVERGHVIANHTHTHPMSPHMDQLPIAERADQIDRATAAIVQATGVRPCAYRSPGSHHRTPGTQRLANQRDLRVAHWTHNTYDSRYVTGDDRRRAVEEIVARATTPVHERPVVLLHDGGGVAVDRSFTVAALEPLVRTYRARGYGFVDVAGSPFRRVDRSIVDACAVPAQTVGGFDDVALGATHRPGILCAVRWGVASGRTARSFAPERSVTRAQVATMLHGLLRAVGHRTAGSPPVGFTDVGGSVHREAIEALAAAGVVAGRADGTYGPNEPVRRDQLASMLVRALDRVAGPRPPAALRFTDVDPGSVHADAVARLAAAGVVHGVTTHRFAPNDRVTRAQMATFAMRSAALLVREGHGHTR